MTVVSNATSIEQALHDLMISNEVISTEFATHIYFGLCPQVNPAPDKYIVISDFNREPNYHLSGDAGIDRTRVQIDMWARDPRGVEVVGDKAGSAGDSLKTVLSGIRQEVGSIHIKSCTIERDQVLSNPPDDKSGNRRHRRSIDFVIYHSRI